MGSEMRREEDWYENHYSSVNSSADCNSIAFRVLHRFLEKGFDSNSDLRILEVGANIGEHVPFVSYPWKSYTATDLRMPSTKKIAELANLSVDFKYADIERLPFASESFDRVISTCVFHHLSNPDEALREMLRVTTKGGAVSILLPNDPGIAYRLMRAVTTLRKARKLNLLQSVQLEHAKQHRNHYLSLKTILKDEAKDYSTKIDYFPFKFPLYNLNLISRIVIVKESRTSTLPVGAANKSDS